MYSGYTACAHQLCGAHLIRELTAVEQDHSEAHWHRQTRSALAVLAREAGRVRCGQAEQIPTGVLLTQWELFPHGIAVGLSAHPRAEGKKQSPARNLLEHLRVRSGQVFRTGSADVRAVAFMECQTAGRPRRALGRSGARTCRGCETR